MTSSLLIMMIDRLQAARKNGERSETNGGNFINKIYKNSPFWTLLTIIPVKQLLIQTGYGERGMIERNMQIKIQICHSKAARAHVPKPTHFPAATILLQQASCVMMHSILIMVQPAVRFSSLQMVGSIRSKALSTSPGAQVQS